MRLAIFAATQIGRLMTLLSKRFGKSENDLINLAEFKAMLADKSCRDFFAVRGLEMKDAEASSVVCMAGDSIFIKHQKHMNCTRNQT